MAVRLFAPAALAEPLRLLLVGFTCEAPDVEVELALDDDRPLRDRLDDGEVADVVIATGEDEAADAAARLPLGGWVTLALDRVCVVVATRDSRVLEAVDIARPDIRLAVPRMATPPGASVVRAIEAMSGDDYGLPAVIGGNVVAETPSTAAAAERVLAGAADAAIVHVSDALRLGSLRAVSLPEEARVETRYLVAVTEAAPRSAARLVDHLRSPAGDAVLRDAGLARPV